MATLTASQQVNIPTDFLWAASGFSFPSFPTATQIVITDGVHTQIFKGENFSFDFSNQSVISGTITSTEYYESGVLVYVADQFAVDVAGLSKANLTEKLESIYLADNQIFGSSANDKIKVFGGDDSINGGDGNDVLTGAAGDDSLFGENGNDVLFGSAGADILNGGLGKDRLTGGGLADTFVFSSLADSGVKATTRDIIVDFKTGVDKIDLSALDGDTTTAAEFNEVAAFSTAPVGEGEWLFDAGTHILSVNTDTDVQAEFSVLLTGVVSLQASDLILA